MLFMDKMKKNRNGCVRNDNLFQLWQSGCCNFYTISFSLVPVQGHDLNCFASF